MAFPKTVGIIPARINSSRFPRKLLQKLKGKAVLERTIENAQNFSLDDLFVATDNFEIANLAKEAGTSVIMTSSSLPTGTDRVREATFANASLHDAEIIFNLQGDHPFTSAKTIDLLKEELLNDPFAEVATAVTPLFDAEKAARPDTVKCVFDQNHTALYFSRAPIPHKAKIYHQHIGIYAFRRRFLEKLPTLKPAHLESVEDLEQLRFMENGIKIKVALTDEIPQGIDVPQDILTSEKLLCP